jgi:hypothetical protein
MQICQIFTQVNQMTTQKAYARLFLQQKNNHPFALSLSTSKHAKDFLLACLTIIKRISHYLMLQNLHVCLKDLMEKANSLFLRDHPNAHSRSSLKTTNWMRHEPYRSTE